jgi:hypothetical protein
MYDIIGDIHGQAGKLKALLSKLDYAVERGAYRHPDGRQALFLGDLIDRGPEQVETIRIVRDMIEAGSGRSIMGNHEWNAIGYATPSPDGQGHLRPRTGNKRLQHREFLRQVGEDSAVHRELVECFKTLPPVLDLGDLRLCHAWWNPDYVNRVLAHMDDAGTLDEEFLMSSYVKHSPAYVAMEGMTKGLEVDLPGGARFVDHSGISRGEIRLTWWDENALTYREAAMVPHSARAGIPALALPADLPMGLDSPVPVFVGHYWLSGTPRILGPRVACLDYGAGLSGPLVAYRWNGETLLSNDNFVAAGADLGGMPGILEGDYS